MILRELELAPDVEHLEMKNYTVVDLVFVHLASAVPAKTRWAIGLRRGRLIYVS